MTRGGLLFMLGLTLLLAADGRAQESEASGARADSLETEQSSADTAGGITPGGAFFRGVLIPGWGHSATGSSARAGFYVATEAASLWMLFKSHRRFLAARERADNLGARLRRDLIAQGYRDPQEIDDALLADPNYEELIGLADARAEQREDWLAFGLFMLLVSGIDAFVSAHLDNFPEPLEIDGDPETGRVEARISLPASF